MDITQFKDIHIGKEVYFRTNFYEIKTVLITKIEVDVELKCLKVKFKESLSDSNWYDAVISLDEDGNLKIDAVIIFFLEYKEVKKYLLDSLKSAIKETKKIVEELKYKLNEAEGE